MPMSTINNHTMRLIADYLEKYHAVFALYLNSADIEPFEADVIIDDLRQCFAVDIARRGPVIDRKFIIHAINPVNGKHYDSHDAILLCAKDRAVPAALHAYQAECMRIGANEEHVAGIGLLIDRVEAYQAHVENRVPDTVGAEIDRCLYGAGI